MNTTIKTLEGVDYETIHQAFHAAFSDYLVDISYMTLDVLTRRFKKNGYQPELSAGLFVGDKLKGFTIVGTGMFKGEAAAFDIMTGITSHYRGQGFAGQLFDSILGAIQDQAIPKFYLEVLQENRAAIKSYTKSGFTITRGLECYSLTIGKLHTAKLNQINLDVVKINKKDIDQHVELMDWEPSWENHPESIQRIPDEVITLGIKLDKKIIGLCTYYPTLKWILMLAVARKFRRKGIGSALLEHILDNIPVYTREIKLLNVDDDDQGMNKFLLDSGFQRITSQYEMMYEIN